MRDVESRFTPVSELIDASADVQSEPSEVAVEAGVASLRVMFRSGMITVPVDLTIRTSTGFHRGVHMSRLVRAANNRKDKSLEGWLKWICGEVNKTQPTAEVVATLELPYEDRFAKISLKTTKRGAITYRYTVQGMTACPCSKKMIGIGHMQRAEILLVLKSPVALDSRRTVQKLEECFSAAPREEMKRIDEAKKILEAQSNPRFAEDLVRECLKRFPNAVYVSSRCFESIHAHDAVATWSERPGWVPAF